MGNRTHVTETVSGVTRGISNTYDPLNHLIHSEYTSGEAFTYHYDPVGNRTAMTSTTPLSGTVVTTHTFDPANRLTDRAVSDGRAYTYTWSHRGQMLAEYTQGIPVRTFSYDSAGQLVKATVFTLTTEFVYNGLGARVALSVTGQTTRYTLDYAVGNRILAETTPTNTVDYLYGRECLGEFRDDVPLYYLPDGEGYVRQGADADGDVVSAWLFDPDGVVLEGPEGLVSHLVCGGVYDWSTGLLYQNGRYFDPVLGIWLMLAPLVVVQAWRKRRKGGHPWMMLVCMGILVVSILTGCEKEDAGSTACVEIPTLTAPPSITLHNNFQFLGADDEPSYGSPDEPGVEFEASVHLPERCIAYGGLFFRQHIISHRTLTTVDTDGREITWYQGSKDWMCDGRNLTDPSDCVYEPSLEFIEPSMHGETKELQASDSPRELALNQVQPGVTGEAKHWTVDEKFIMHVVWNPLDHWISLGYVEWNWKAEAEKSAPNGKWEWVENPTSAHEAGVILAVPEELETNLENAWHSSWTLTKPW